MLFLKGIYHSGGDNNFRQDQLRLSLIWMLSKCLLPRFQAGQPWTLRYVIFIIMKTFKLQGTEIPN